MKPTLGPTSYYVNWHLVTHEVTGVMRGPVGPVLDNVARCDHSGESVLGSPIPGKEHGENMDYFFSMFLEKHEKKKITMFFHTFIEMI